MHAQRIVLAIDGRVDRDPHLGLAYPLHHAARAEWVQLDEPEFKSTITSAHHVSPCPVEIIKNEETPHTNGRRPTLDIGHDLRAMIGVMMQKIDHRRYFRFIGLLP